ncbi:MAG: glycosyltransferase [Planctomycetota bacterium]
MRILLVAMSDSIHTARWISQIADQGWDIHLFPSVDYGITHPDIRNITVYHFLYAEGGKEAKNRGIPVFSKNIALLGGMFIKRYLPRYRAVRLKRLIRKLRPDIIHSMEIQHAGCKCNYSFL